MVKAKKRLRYVAICGASIWNQFAEQKDQYYLGIDPELLLRTYHLFANCQFDVVKDIIDDCN